LISLLEIKDGALVEIKNQYDKFCKLNSGIKWIYFANEIGRKLDWKIKD